ncbi:MAG: ribosomal protein S18-alanine N-acetyltransferase [Hyphomicrobiales bacterium]
MTRAVTLECGSADGACLDDLARLHGECFATPWPASDFARLLAMPGAFSIIARDGNATAGFILARGAGDEAEIITLGVAQPFRRRGIASRLLERAADRLRADGAVALFMEVAQDNEAAVGLYRMNGFETVGSRPAYYRAPDGTRSDAVVMKRQL